MQKYEVQIEGITPYMQDRMDEAKLEEWEKQRGFVIERDDVSKEDYIRALSHAYINSKNKPFIPASHIRGALINAGGFIKSKVGVKNKSMKGIVAAMFFVKPEEILLSEQWEIDKRSAINHNNKSRIIKYRPRWDNWKACFQLWIDNDTITEQTIKKIIEYAGQYVGIGSYTPQHNGMYGRFIVNKFSKID